MRSAGRQRRLLLLLFIVIHKGEGEKAGSPIRRRVHNTATEIGLTVFLARNPYFYLQISYYTIGGILPTRSRVDDLHIYIY
jgi:hypothetical protein